MDLLSRQKLAADWLERATGDRVRQVRVTDPIYQAVVEGRDKPTKGYSSCGDLAHWLLYRLGVRTPWVNREEHLGWQGGKNVSKLCWPPAPVKDPTPELQLEAGDICVIWSKPDTTDAHVICVLEHERGSRVLCIAEYGQRRSLNTNEIGGHARNCIYGDGWRLGTRSIHKVLQLKDVLAQAEATGDLVEPELLGHSY